MQKALSRTLLVLYILVLIWLVLFKFSFNVSMLLHHQTGLNLIPFAPSPGTNGRIDLRDIIDNCLFFIPLGLLLGVNLKEMAFRRKLALILAFSLVAEAIQYIFAIGVADITDVITNTLGGFLGLALYEVGRKFIINNKLDRIINSAGFILFLLFIANVARLLLHHRR